MYLDSMRMFNWPSLIFILPGLLAYTWPTNMGNKELFVQAMHNDSDLVMTLWQDNCCRPYSYCLLWFKQLQSSQCPFIKLLIHCLIALPVYNLLLLLIGWHLNSSASKAAERMLLVLKPERSLTTAPAMITVSTPPPAPPPRYKRYAAPKPPTRRLRSTVNTPDKYPSQKDPFATVEQSEQYKSLRRNLIKVLEGLQQPISQLPLPLPMPMPVMNSTQYNSVEEKAAEQTKKKKSRKWLRAVVKRLGKPFGKGSNDKQLEEREVNTSNSVSSGSNVWQRFRLRGSRRTQFYVPSASSSETISSSSCIYAY